jgi:hypothetical protein
MYVIPNPKNLGLRAFDRLVTREFSTSDVTTSFKLESSDIVKVWVSNNKSYSLKVKVELEGAIIKLDRFRGHSPVSFEFLHLKSSYHHKEGEQFPYRSIRVPVVFFVSERRTIKLLQPSAFDARGRNQNILLFPSWTPSFWGANKMYESHTKISQSCSRSIL